MTYRFLRLLIGALGLSASPVGLHFFPVFFTLLQVREPRDRFIFTTLGRYAVGQSFTRLQSRGQNSLPKRESSSSISL